MRQYKGAIIAILCFGILVGVYYLISNLQSAPPQHGSESEMQFVSFYTCSADDIIKITVTNAAGQYSFVRNNNKWQLEGTDYEELNQERVVELSHSMSFFDGELIDEQPKDLEQYGLVNPTATATIEFEDGTSDTFLLGPLSATASGYYMKTDKDDKVYAALVSKNESLNRPLGYYRNQEFLRFNAQVMHAIEWQHKDMQHVVVTAKSADEDVSLTGWRMTSPFVGDVFNDHFGKYVVDPLYDPVMIKEYVSDDPADLAVYGLNPPESTVTIREEDKDVVLLFGREEGSYVFAKKAESPIVYRIEKTPFEFRKLNPMNLVSKMLVNIRLSDISTMVFTVEGKAYALDIANSQTSSINDTKISVADLKVFYENFMLLGIRGAVTEPVTGDPYMMLKITKKDGNVVDLTLTSYNERYLAATMNGRTDFYYMKSDVDAMLKKLYELETIE